MMNFEILIFSDYSSSRHRETATELFFGGNSTKFNSKNPKISSKASKVP
jgi:hypothetical protein